MIKNYFTIAYRHLLKNKAFSLINILGLAIGMAACLLILQYVSFELSYDDFRRPDIYRVVEYSYVNGESVEQRAQTVPALAPAVRSDIPEVVQAARLIHAGPLMSDPVLQVGDRSFHEESIYFADSTFLTMFSYSMVQGDEEQALVQPGSLVLSASMAEKYFPDQEAMGQLLTFHRGERGSTSVKVTGIFEDVPANTHLHTDFLFSFNSLPAEWNLDENWEWGNFYNYVEVTPGTSPSSVRKKVADVFAKYRREDLAEWKKVGYTRELDVQPIRQIHLNSSLEAEAEPNGSRRTVKFLTLIAVFILIIAWINYLNLTTAKAVERAKEVGIRKVVGGHRQQLIAQFMTESLVINLLAALLAFTLSQLLMPSFRFLTQGHLTSTFTIEIGGTLLGLFLVGTSLSGLYPAFVLSSYQPLSVLKGSMRGVHRGAFLRKGLVMLQFAATVALIAGTLIVRGQLDFMRERDLGFDMEQTLVVKGPGLKDSTYQQHLTYFKNEVSQRPEMQLVSVSSSVPGRELSWARGFYQPARPEDRVGTKIVAVDEDFFALYGTTFRAGRNFDREISSDREALIFNEAAIRRLGFASAEAAIQQPVIWDEDDDDQQMKTIIGVVEDFHQESLHREVEPMVFALKRYLRAPWAGEYYSLKISTSDYPTAVARIQQDWAEAFPGSPFDSFFLDDHFNHQYRADRQFGHIFSLFAGLAILIACLGLFGLSSYVTLQRAREISIRKVLGASTRGVVALLSQDFVRLVVVASVFMVPLIYWGGQRWLKNYAYRIEIQWWRLALPVGLVWLLALTTISFQTVRAALANPVDSLRSE